MWSLKVWKKFNNFLVCKSLEKTFFLSVSMEKQNNSPDLIF